MLGIPSTLDYRLVKIPEAGSESCYFLRQLLHQIAKIY